MPKNDDKLADFAKEVWGKRAEGLPVPGFDITRPPSHDDVLYMLKRYAFVQIINPEGGEETGEIKFIRTKSNLVVLDYDTAMCVSPGEKLFGSEQYEMDQQGNYHQLNTGTGTIVKQIVDTGAEMVSLAQKKGWQRIHIVAGQPLMKWAIWAAAKELNMEVSGFIPSKEDIAKYDRVKGEFKSIIQPGPTKVRPE